jgi:hypothetical protein
MCSSFICLFFLLWYSFLIDPLPCSLFVLLVGPLPCCISSALRAPLPCSLLLLVVLLVVLLPYSLLVFLVLLVTSLFTLGALGAPSCSFSLFILGVLDILGAPFPYSFFVLLVFMVAPTHPWVLLVFLVVLFPCLLFGPHGARS